MPQEQDPLSVQDLVEDGMTEYLPETDAYLRELGLMVEHESLLPSQPLVHTSEFEAVANADTPPKVLRPRCSAHRAASVAWGIGSGACGMVCGQLSSMFCGRRHQCACDRTCSMLCSHDARDSMGHRPLMQLLMSLDICKLDHVLQSNIETQIAVPAGSWSSWLHLEQLLLAAQPTGEA